MEFLERMNAVVDAIEAGLDGDIDYAHLAHQAGCSEYHLSRMFPFLTGQSLSLYIRRRRLSQAALELREPGADLLTLAVRYGYSSVEAFRRAFREVHGVTPSAVASGLEAARTYPRLSFQMHVTGVSAMVNRLVTLPAFFLVGVSRRVPLVYSGPNPALDEVWTLLTPEAIQRWKAHNDSEPRGIISASYNFSDDRLAGSGTLDYLVGVAASSPLASDASVAVEEGLWAVFEAVGNFPHGVQTLWGRIFSEWFPSSPYELRSGPEILWNEGPDTSKPAFRSEIWIPVRKATKV